MSWSKGERLYQLLPAIYRIRDAERGQVLRTLLSVIESEVETVEGDIERLYENWFIETCDEWVVPYIGDLVRARSLNAVPGTTVASQRAYVANTLRYRRRKGTLSMLEQLAHDTTGWPASAVEMFQRLITSQHVKHVRAQSLATAGLRDSNRLELVNGPFEEVNHSLEVRRIASERGRYNIPNIGIFLWRLQSYFLVRTTARAAADSADGRYRFNPLGRDQVLYNRAKIETDITQLAEEVNVPDALRRRALYEDLEAHRRALSGGEEATTRYLDADEPVLQVYIDSDEPLPPEQIVVCNLEDWDEAGWSRPAPISNAYPGPDGSPVTWPVRVAIDPALGRLALAEDEPTPVRLELSHTYGFSADVGGGPYSRRETLAVADADTWTITVDQASGPASTLAAALSEWSAAAPARAIIEIGDSASYEESLAIELGPVQTLAIQAVDGARPHVHGDLTVTGADASDARLVLDGLLLEGSLEVEGVNLSQLVIRHCTLVPGLGVTEAGEPLEPDAASLIIDEGNGALSVEIDHCICGALRSPETITALAVRDSIVQSPVSQADALPALAGDEAGDEPGPATTLDRTTVFGRVFVRQLDLASECICNDPVIAVRRQVGCTRFSYVPEGSAVPRRFRCQPDLALEGITDPVEEARVRTRLTPVYTSTRYGDPGYAQLARAGADEIATGAEDGAEMGAFKLLEQPQRAANLRSSLEEYLRSGLETGLYFMT